MTKIVYASPDIPPEVWTPPRGVLVLPLSEHPAIVAESRVEKLPPEYKKRSDPTRVLMLMKYLRTHPPATARTISDDLTLDWRGVKTTLLANKRLFRKVGEVKGTNGMPQTVWGLTER